jgi:hypothetical protein
MEVDLITEVKYPREEGVNPLVEVDPQVKGVDLQEVEEDFLEDVGVGHLVAPG